MKRRRLYTGEENAAKGLLLLRIAAVGSLLLTGVFVYLFNLAKHDPVLSAANPFAEDPYDAVGSFGIQLGSVCAVIAAIRALRTDLKTESLTNRYTYAIRAMAVSGLAIVVTMIADMIALVRHSSQWERTEGANGLVIFTGGLFLLGVLFSFSLMRLARRREVCSQNPLRRRQMVPFLVLCGVLCVYPAVWRESVPGAILCAIAGMLILFYSVALLSNAMFPCPDIPEKDLVDDLYGFFNDMMSRAGFLPSGAGLGAQTSGVPPSGKILGLLNPRKHEWNLLALIAILMGLSLALAEIFSDGASPGSGRLLLVGIVFVVIESAGIVLGYALFKRFLGLMRSA